MFCLKAAVGQKIYTCFDDCQELIAIFLVLSFIFIFFSKSSPYFGTALILADDVGLALIADITALVDWA